MGKMLFRLGRWAGLLAAVAMSTWLAAGPAHADGGREIHSLVEANKCMDVRSQDLPRDAQVQIWDCSGKPEQLWSFSFAGTDANGAALYHLSDARTRGCLTEPSGSTVGADVRMQPCDSRRPDQKWRMELIPFTSKWVIWLNSSGLCLDLRGANASNGSHIQQYTCNGTKAQQWGPFFLTLS